MQVTYRVPVEALNSGFLDMIKASFAGKEISITVEEVTNSQPINQKELYKKSLPLLERFNNMRVDPALNLSDLANEVNL
ncbi:hypothetical protein ACO2Q8_18100 [Larkinella sp. VNQ87]|uniref:hypothetical protein n=1 Tax=Larkinella sp. VNQ87 TaxID=3400921 RepID=UPI003C00018C